MSKTINYQKTLDYVRVLAAAASGYAFNTITEFTTPNEIGFDSLDQTEFVMMLEHAYKIDISKPIAYEFFVSMQELANGKTAKGFGDITRMIMVLRKSPHATVEQVLAGVTELKSRHGGVLVSEEKNRWRFAMPELLGHDPTRRERQTPYRPAVLAL